MVKKALFATSLILMAAGCGVAASESQTQSPGSLSAMASNGSSVCPANPLANVYHPYRLQVQNACQIVTGVVASAGQTMDGDIHMQISLDPSESNLLNSVNMAKTSGQLIAEIVPADQPGCTPGRPPKPPHGTYNYGICTGRDLQTPNIGDRVTLVGSYNLDTDHGWMELHPVWSITVNQPSSGPRLPLAQIPEAGD